MINWQALKMIVTEIGRQLSGEYESVAEGRSPTAARPSTKAPA